MNRHKQLNRLGLLASCALLLACSPSAKQYTNDAPAARSGPVTIDNDSYYSQPGSFQPAGGGGYGGCGQINDAPSCGGG